MVNVKEQQQQKKETKENLIELLPLSLVWEIGSSITPLVDL